VRSQDIRERFLNFFASRGHERLQSFSLIPHDDPSLLFTSAGMVPLKPYILGQKHLAGNKATSAQKCFRVVDIEEIGDDTHHTFFEMLGNWSFGEYFKEGAIELAWELLTSEFGLDPARLLPSVYPDDRVAEDIWVERIGIPRDKVSRLEDNWWQAGPTGPCGYDSEVYWDWGSPCSCGRTDCLPQDECGGDRWTEVWNLVFMEFDQDAGGERVLLPRPTVDTGMGMERITGVLQGVRSNYDTDLLHPIVEGFERRSSADRERPGDVVALRVLTDHLRAGAFLIGDGVVPGNEGRGYVLRRVLRRASLFGRRVQLRDGLAGGLGELAEVMGDVYPELVERRSVIEETMRGEDTLFENTLSAGLDRLEKLLAGGASHIGGADAFRLHDTFGFPIELTVELARERGAEVDMEGFRAAMEAQRARSRAHAERAGFAAGPALPATTFVGYDVLGTDADVVHVSGPDGAAEIGEGRHGEVVIEPTPFYAEGGGQIGDRGTLEWEGGEADVLDTQYAPGGNEVRVSAIEVRRGVLTAGTAVRAAVDAERRAQTARHHSATHLLHRALKDVLGEGVVQRGSWVGPDHTTFDFNFPRALTSEELESVQHEINEAIRRNLVRTATVMPIVEAQQSGAVALFGEKYGDSVRVVDFGGWSRELCGGTHVERSGDIGAAIIAGEQSIGQGTRRIDMLAGEAAERLWTQQQSQLREAAAALRARPEELAERIMGLQAQVKAARREAEEARRASLGGGRLGDAEFEQVDGVRFGALILDGDRKSVADAADALSDRLDGGVALVIGNGSVVVKAGKNARDRGVSAVDLFAVASAVVGARGGGKPDRAEGGGVIDHARGDDAIAAVRAAITAASGGRS
jgi:alanyl-tRNA synthetase